MHERAITTIDCLTDHSCIAVGDVLGQISFYHLPSIDVNELQTRPVSELSLGREKPPKAKSSSSGLSLAIAAGAKDVMHWHAHAVSDLRWAQQGKPAVVFGRFSDAVATRTC